jgi:hypothetical protein
MNLINQWPRFVPPAISFLSSPPYKKKALHAIPHPFPDTLPIDCYPHSPRF